MEVEEELIATYRGIHIVRQTGKVSGLQYMALGNGVIHGIYEPRHGEDQIATLKRIKKDLRRDLGPA